MGAKPKGSLGRMTTRPSLIRQIGTLPERRPCLTSYSYDAGVAAALVSIVKVTATWV